MAQIKSNPDTLSDFDAYRRQMHTETDNGRPVVPAPKKAVRIGFGIFMIILYIGVGVLLLVNFFGWDTLAWARYGLGVLFIIYGIFRGYRMFSGADYTAR